LRGVVAMVCYVFPAIGAILVHATRKVRKSEDDEGRWLALLLAGGSIFGIVDHWWNGELAMVGPNPVNDILLGAAITVVICAFWYAALVLPAASRAPQALPQPEKRQGIGRN
jgi:hypothetical protein